MKRVLLSEMKVVLSTTASRRNLVDMDIATLLGDYDQCNTLTEQLKKNNVGLNDPNSAMTISDIKSYIFLLATLPLDLTITKSAQSTTFTMNRFFVVTADITSLLIKNLSQTEDVPLKIVYS